MIASTLHPTTTIADDTIIISHLVEVALQGLYCKTLFTSPHHLVIILIIWTLSRVHRNIRRSEDSLSNPSKHSMINANHCTRDTSFFVI